MPGNTPAAVVQQGTLPVQRKVVSTLKNLVMDAEAAEIHSPAVIVVGGVAALSERFDWFSRLPLFGRKIVVTRPKARMGTLSNRLRALGADVLEYPCIETVPREGHSALEEALNLSYLNRYEWVAFTSSVGVEVFFEALWKRGMDCRSLSGLKFAAIGPSTAQALEQWRIHPDYVPEVYDTEHLAQGLAERTVGKVLLPRAAMGSPILPEVLTEKGVSFSDVPIYDTLYRSGAVSALTGQLEEGETVVTFTSASTVRGFVRSLPVGTDLTNVLGACIGPQTAAECARYAIRTMTADKATIPALIDTILRL